MNRLKIFLGVLAAVLVAEFAAVSALSLLVYQVTPKSTLAHDTFIGRVPGLLAGLRVLDRSFNVLYRGHSAPEKLLHYELKIDAADMQKIEESLPTDLPSPWYGNVFLTENAKEWVKGTFVADGQEYAVDVRVRGDIFNHWAYRKKSWRIKFPDDKLFQGIREMNLIIPEDRGWIAEPLASYRAKKFGFLQPPIQYVTVSLNGSDPLIYTQVEQFGKEMMEKQARAGDVNIYGAGGGTSYFQQWDDVFVDTAYWQKYGTALAPPEDSFEEMEAVRSLGRAGSHLDPNYKGRIEALFDIEKLTNWYALALVSGSSHARDHNLRLFHDISRGKLEPIPWDINLYWPRTFLSLPGNPFLNEIFRVPEFKLQAYQTLWAYVNNDQQIEEDLAEADRLRRMVEAAAYRDSLKLQSNRQVHAELNERMAQVQANIDFSKEELKRSEVLVDQRLSSNADSARGLLYTIDATTRGISPAFLAEISVPKSFQADMEQGKIVLLRDDGDFSWDAADKVIPVQLRATPDKADLPVFQTKDEKLTLIWAGEPTYDAGEEVIAAPHTRHRFYLVRKSGAAQFAKEDVPLNLEFTNAVTKDKAQVIGDVLIDNRTFERLAEAYADRATFLKNNPAFDPEGDNGVLLQGSITFSRSVIVPAGMRLSIAPGTTVRLSKGVTLLSYSPVTVVGTEKNPIRFESQSADPWGVFLILNAKGQSDVAWAEFSNGSEAFINDTYATGMVAFHGSPVKIRNSTFRNSHGDDALNIKYIPADLAQLHFENAGADALDIDMAASGVLEDSTFFVAPGDTDSNGDGVDLSWSPITIRRLIIEGSRDKCISIGESSRPTIEDVTLKNCHYGIAAKDAAEPTVTRAKFIGNDIAVAAYIKKNIFTQPKIEIRESTFEGNKVEQSGAIISIIR